MKIQILGSGCPTCKKLYETVKNVAEKIDQNIEVEYSDDIVEIVKLGAMSSPVMAIDGKLIFSGKIPSVEEIENIINEKMKGNEVEKDEKAQGGCSCEGNC